MSGNRGIYEKERSVARMIAREAGALMRKAFEEPIRVERKSDNTPLTETDQAINAYVISELQKYFSDGIIGEEQSTAEYDMGRRWLCDPIDGTKAFTWGLPTAMFSLALVNDGVPVLGVALDPFLDRLYEGVVGEGSFCNDARLTVAPGAVAGHTIGVSSQVEKVLTDEHHIGMLRRFKERGAYLASFSGAVYKACLVARGRFVAYVDFDVNAHDIAAAQVIVEEAGGLVSGVDGERLDYSKPFKGAIVSNAECHTDVALLVQGHPLSSPA